MKQLLEGSNVTIITQNCEDVDDQYFYVVIETNNINLAKIKVAKVWQVGKVDFDTGEFQLIHEFKEEIQAIHNYNRHILVFVYDTALCMTKIYIPRVDGENQFENVSKENQDVNGMKYAHIIQGKIDNNGVNRISVLQDFTDKSDQLHIVTKGPEDKFKL